MLLNKKNVFLLKVLHYERFIHFIYTIIFICIVQKTRVIVQAKKE